MKEKLTFSSLSISGNSTLNLSTINLNCGIESCLIAKNSLSDDPVLKMDGLIDGFSNSSNILNVQTKVFYQNTTINSAIKMTNLGQTNVSYCNVFGSLIVSTSELNLNGTLLGSGSFSSSKLSMSNFNVQGTAYFANYTSVNGKWLTGISSVQGISSITSLILNLTGTFFLNENELNITGVYGSQSSVVSSYLQTTGIINVLGSFYMNNQSVISNGNIYFKNNLALSFNSSLDYNSGEVSINGSMIFNSSHFIIIGNISSLNAVINSTSLYIKSSPLITSGSFIFKSNYFEVVGIAQINQIFASQYYNASSVNIFGNFSYSSQELKSSGKFICTDIDLTYGNLQILKKSNITSIGNFSINKDTILSSGDYYFSGLLQMNEKTLYLQGILTSSGLLGFYQGFLNGNAFGSYSSVGNLNIYGIFLVDRFGFYVSGNYSVSGTSKYAN